MLTSYLLPGLHHCYMCNCYGNLFDRDRFTNIPGKHRSPQPQLTHPHPQKQKKQGIYDRIELSTYCTRLLVKFILFWKPQILASWHCFYFAEYCVCMSSGFYLSTEDVMFVGENVDSRSYSVSTGQAGYSEICNATEIWILTVFYVPWTPVTLERLRTEICDVQTRRVFK